MTMSFDYDDLEHLKRLDDNDLYRLNIVLLETTNEKKQLCMSNKSLILELVRLTETAAQEVAWRKHYHSQASKGIFSYSGITYDTKEYRKWLKDKYSILGDNFDCTELLSEFSFGNKIIELM